MKKKKKIKWKTLIPIYAMMLPGLIYSADQQLRADVQVWSLPSNGLTGEKGF